MILVTSEEFQSQLLGSNDQWGFRVGRAEPRGIRQVRSYNPDRLPKVLEENDWRSQAANGIPGPRRATLFQQLHRAWAGSLVHCLAPAGGRQGQRRHTGPGEVAKS